jgi:hypothetical protein
MSNFAFSVKWGICFGNLLAPAYYPTLPLVTAALKIAKPMSCGIDRFFPSEYPSSSTLSTGSFSKHRGLVRDGQSIDPVLSCPALPIVERIRSVTALGIRFFVFYASSPKTRLSLLKTLAATAQRFQGRIATLKRKALLWQAFRRSAPNRLVQKQPGANSHRHRPGNDVISTSRRVLVFCCFRSLAVNSRPCVVASQVFDLSLLADAADIARINLAFERARRCGHASGCLNARNSTTRRNEAVSMGRRTSEKLR